MAAALACSACQGPLVVTIIDSDDDDDRDEEVSADAAASNGDCGVSSSETLPDDVLLPCGCHFHWQCLFDLYSSANCPSCGSNILSQSASAGQEVLCSLNNEGGLQEGVDILPMLTEEVYLRTYPEQRRSRAFLAFCRSGDVPAIVEMLQESAEDEQANENRRVILTYQDNLCEAQSGLHCAVREGHTDVAWLLLLLASHLELSRFPPIVLHEAEVLGISRGDASGMTDIRSLLDANNRSPEDLAWQTGGIWADWLGKGLLSI